MHSFSEGVKSPIFSLCQTLEESLEMLHPLVIPGTQAVLENMPLVSAEDPSSILFQEYN